MSSRGILENKKLQDQLEEQLTRLVTQMADLEECRDEIDEEEYEEVKKDTLEQLTEFKESLSKMTSGNMTLVDSINSMQLAIQAAVSEAFKTPEIISMFAKKQPDQLREKLAEIEMNNKINKISFEAYTQQKVEILMALQKLGEVLKAEEQTFLESNSSATMKNFDKVDDGMRSGEKAMEIARKAIQ